MRELLLPQQIQLVFESAAQIVADRMGRGVDPAQLTSAVEGIRSLMPLIAGSAGLRHVLRERLHTTVTDETALALISIDTDLATNAISTVGKLLDESRRRHRRQHRAERRAKRPDAEERRLARFEQRISELRTVRERQEQQLTTLREENAELHSTIENLDVELAQLRRQLNVVYSRLERVRQERDAAAEQHLSRRTPALTRDLSPMVEVLGGGTEIGGSCVLVSAGGTKVLIDAGTRPTGVDEESLAPPDIGRLNESPPDAIIVTHAHNDHAGWVPALVSRFGRLPVIASTATGDLLSTMWADSAKVMARRADRDESWAGGPLPPYSQSDVDDAVTALRDQPIGRKRRIGAVDIELFNAGHIIGATGVVVTAGEHRIVVSGDVSMPGQESVGGLELPESAIGAQLMLLESTYAGSSKQQPREAIIEQLVSDIDRVLGDGGRVLIPAFALGRAQEIALICQRYLPEAEVLIDGMARDLSIAYERHDGPNGERLSIFSGNIRPVEPGRTRHEIAENRPCVVISTSGMLTAGPAVGWARAILPDKNSALMVVGYQDSDSPGSRLLSLENHRGRDFLLPDNDEPVRVAADINQYRLGAHASEEELVDIATQARPKMLMLVHGKLAGQRQFEQRMRLRRQPVMLADQPWQLP